MLYYSKQLDMEMEAEEKYNKNEKYRIPLSIFEVIHKNKMIENTEAGTDIKGKKSNSKELRENFLFPLSTLF